MSVSPQNDYNFLTVDAAGFAAITQSQLPEDTWVNNTTTGILYLSMYVLGVMTLVSMGPTGAAGDTIIFLDPTNGSDTNPGTQALPVKTLAVAWSLLPSMWFGKCRVQCVEPVVHALITAAGRYSPGYPLGPLSTARCILGAPLTVVASGSVNTITTGLVTNNILTPNVGGMTVDAFKGWSIRPSSGTKLNNIFPIAHNDATTIESIAALTGMVNGDTFDIVRATTEFQTNGPAFIGTGGGVGIWGVKFTGGGMSVNGTGMGLWLDNCEYNETVNRLTVAGGASLNLANLIGILSPAGTSIVDAGTLLGSTALFLHATFFAGAAIQCTNNGILNGRLISQNCQITAGANGNLGGQINLLAMEIDLSVATTTQPAVSLDQNSTFAQGVGYARIVGGGSGGSVGFQVFDRSFAYVVGCQFTNCASGAVSCILNGFVSLTACTGSTGNLVGMILGTGGSYTGSANTVTGTNGDVEVDSQFPVTWATINLLNRIQSASGLPGRDFAYAGGFTGAAGATTAFLPIGGLPGSVNGTNNSTTAIRTPANPGGLMRNLALTVLTNTLAGITTAVIMKAPVATGTPAATAVTFAIGAGVSGNFSDLTHSVTMQAGDQHDVRLTETGVGAMTCSGAWNLQ